MPDNDVGAQTRRLLEEVETVLGRWVVLPNDHAKTTLALFTLHTWAIEGAHATPYLIVLSAEKASGKSRLMEVLRLVVRAPWHTASMSEAVLFRIIEQEKPTLLMDETDAIFGGNSERSEALRGILNAGNRRGAVASRISGENHSIRHFNIYCPKVLAGINTGKLPDTITDRGIVINMQRRQAHEHVERFSERKAEQDTAGLRAALGEWGDSVPELLLEAEPSLPAELADRAADSWESLLAIADLAGGPWPARAREAARALNVPTEVDDSRGSQLLAAIRRAFGSERKITSRDLLARINADDAAPFGAWNHGDGLDERGIAKLLKPYGIKPKTIRVADETPRGYNADAFTETFARYLPQHRNANETNNPYETGDVLDVVDVVESDGVRVEDVLVPF
jgi:hypothetical protein